MKRVALASICILILSACNKNAEASDNLMNVDDLTVDNLIVNDTSATDTAIPGPNYAEEENGTYSYIAAVSEEEQKRGRAAGNVLRYVFRGVSRGVYRISLVDDYGRPISDSECTKPCAVIKTSGGGTVVRRGFTPESLIGAAFQDALNGYMKVTPEPRLESSAQTIPIFEPDPRPYSSRTAEQAGADADNALDAASNVIENVANAVENASEY
jgi:hypothetical protein